MSFFELSHLKEWNEYEQKGIELEILIPTNDPKQEILFEKVIQREISQDLLNEGNK